ncbi:ABC transporter ATP-binding protein [Brevibacillus choshinensis]|uniref:Dipeptide ABC transporter ATP-binding protein n=1 Tax=Brevibacillus choshinensis TaxID=54911 RepID=A0ABX7FPD5_BRECH|nr:dipeptide ABC transporter ATP-binding protein [Brevibacillus choshinensis]QRG67613.1 dipeptide ABC transporter ATP-binding protein [Brevibacillus choshinensis]
MTESLLEVKQLHVHFPVKKGFFQRTQGYVRAVDDVSFSIAKGETFGLVGESGCGKSTTGRAILNLIRPTSGQVLFAQEDLSSISTAQMRAKRKNMQMVFQDPYASLNPRLTVEEILEEPLKAHQVGNPEERKQKIAEMMDVCGLNQSYLKRYAHEFSGGQRQRICIARALILKPELIVADEPVSALDVSIQSQILNLLQDLQEEYQLTYLFISHDLAVVHHLCNRLGVMYLGRMAEIGAAEKIYENPLHPYTQSLLSAIPAADPRKKKERILLRGEVPSPANPPQGCAFVTRCPKAKEICKKERPLLIQAAEDHLVACHLLT